MLHSKCGGPVSFHRGRCFVRLSGRENIAYFQMQFDPAGKPIRAETNLLDPPISKLKGLLAKYSGELSCGRSITEPIVLGTFYDPGEVRFIVNARSYHGNEYLDPSTANNPFRRIHPGPAASMEEYFQSEEYNHWCWHWWNLNGKMNGVRGNWNEESNSWDYPEAEVKFNRCLKDYQVEDSDTLETREVKGSEGEAKQYPFGVSRLMEDRFHEDVEGCNVVVICSHGGAMFNRVQVRKGYDVWFLPGREDKKLGHGNLRHLFIHGCSVMNCFNWQEGQTLAGEWMSGSYVNGVRTVCGTDGNHIGLDRDGWRFFGRYHKGDSIADSWALGLVDECVGNGPATVAYGKTLKAALESLFEGRFSVEPVVPEYSVGSVWINIEIPPR